MVNRPRLFAQLLPMGHSGRCHWLLHHNVHLCGDSHCRFTRAKASKVGSFFKFSTGAFGSTLTSCKKWDIDWETECSESVTLEDYEKCFEQKDLANSAECTVCSGLSSALSPQL